VLLQLFCHVLAQKKYRQGQNVLLSAQKKAGLPERMSCKMITSFGIALFISFRAILSAW